MNLCICSRPSQGLVSRFRGWSMVDERWSQWSLVDRKWSMVGVMVLFIALVAAPLSAQHSPGSDDSRTLSSDAMEAAVVGHESTVDQQRGQLAELLSRPEVRDLARDRGIDMERVESNAAGLDAGEMATVSPLVVKASAALQQGGTITISVVGLILILLILILLT